MSKSRYFGVVTGMSGYGKSEFLKSYMIPELAKDKPVVILDIHNEYSGIKHDGFKAFLQHIATNFKINKGIHVISWRRDIDVIQTINFIRQLQKPVSLIIEEAHSLFESEIYREIKKPLKELTMYGRHYEIDTILSTQRPKNLSTNVRSQAQFFVSFRQEERADIDYLREKESSAGDVVPELKKFDFYSFGPEIPKELKEIKKNQINRLKL